MEQVIPTLELEEEEIQQDLSFEVCELVDLVCSLESNSNLQLKPELKSPNINF